MKQSAQQTPPPLKQETIPSSKPLNQNRDLKGWLSGQKPGLLMTLSLLFLVPSIIGFSTSLIFRNHLDSFSVEETTTQWGKMGSGEVSIDQASSILLKDEVITTFKIQKNNPDYRSYLSLEVETTNTLSDETTTHWPNIGAMGFECSEIWVSSVSHFYYDVPQSMDQIEIIPILKEDYSDYIGNYFYSNEEESLTSEELIARYKKEFPADYATIQVDSTGVETQSGIVTYTVTNPDNVKEYDTLYGTVNIVFKKNGQAVFGVVEPYSTSSSVRSKTFAYSPSIQLPEYDEVEVINMHS